MICFNTQHRNKWFQVWQLNHNISILPIFKHFSLNVVHPQNIHLTYRINTSMCCGESLIPNINCENSQTVKTTKFCMHKLMIITLEWNQWGIPLFLMPIPVVSVRQYLLYILGSGKCLSSDYILGYKLCCYENTP